MTIRSADGLLSFLCVSLCFFVFLFFLTLFGNDIKAMYTPYKHFLCKINDRLFECPLSLLLHARHPTLHPHQEHPSVCTGSSYHDLGRSCSVLPVAARFSHGRVPLFGGNPANPDGGDFCHPQRSAFSHRTIHIIHSALHCSLGKSIVFFRGNNRHRPTSETINPPRIQFFPLFQFRNPRGINSVPRVYPCNLSLAVRKLFFTI